MKPNLTRSPRWLRAALVLPLSVAACGESDPQASASSSAQGNVANGEVLYSQMCAACHGVTGEGGFAPRLNPWNRKEDELVSIIDTRMPQQDPSKCDTECAEDIASYILSWPHDCTGAPAPDRRLRLLTRREYNATVQGLLQSEQSPTATCSTDWDCDIAHESCVAGACVADSCNIHTFTYDGGTNQPNTVHVAGQFNGWSQTIAGGGWAMQRHPTKNLWAAKYSLAAGTYEYKFLLNESTWLLDPKNTATSNGNSVLNVTCADGGAPPGGDPAPSGGSTGIVEPAKDFPAESRPSGYAFDNNADAGLVTAVHVEQCMKAAKLLADNAVLDLSRIVPCDPTNDAKACALEFAKSFGTRAFRRPLTDVEATRYADLVSAQADFKTGVNIALQVMLSSPYFLYRFEIGEEQSDGSFLLTPYEVATALSYNFWGTLPDDALLDAAASGKLSTPEGIGTEARRLLADPRARPIIEVFAVQWLGIEKTTTSSKNDSMFPGFTDTVREAMLEETRRFVSHVVFDGTGKYEELLTADYTFANSALGDLYGLTGLGDEMVKVATPPERQAGLLGEGSVLASYAYPDQSSPVRRGLFVRRNLLCQDLPPPPANVAGVPSVDPNGTTRERFSQHSADAACKGCHQYIDGVGFGFEGFDAIGQYRTTENGKPIDATGNMNDVESLGSGTDAPYATLPELASVIATSESAKDCFAKQAFRFASGRLESPDDVCTLDGLNDRFAKSGYDIRELLVAITQTPNFIVRK